MAGFIAPEKVTTQGCVVGADFAVRTNHSTNQSHQVSGFQACRTCVCTVFQLAKQTMYVVQVSVGGPLQGQPKPLIPISIMYVMPWHVCAFKSYFVRS